MPTPKKKGPFSITMCFRDTPRERRFALRSIPSVIRLDPTEFVIGIDEPVRDDFPGYITGICEKNGFDRLRLVRVPDTPDWNFKMAHTLWECYRACRYDKILGFSVDEELEGDVMLGYDEVGADDTAVVSFTKRLLTRTPGDYMRNVLHRLRIRNRDYVFSGIYWIYRPYYLANVKKEGLQSIANGVDTYMISSIWKQKTHRIVTRKEIGVSCMDYQNEDYPWRQFAYGLWLYANRNTPMAGGAVPKGLNSDPVTRAAINAANRFPFLPALFRAMAYQYPALISGWRWASKHGGSEAVAAATGMSYYDWFMYEYAKHVKDIGRFAGTSTGLG